MVVVMPSRPRIVAIQRGFCATQGMRQLLDAEKVLQEAVQLVRVVVPAAAVTDAVVVMMVATTTVGGGVVGLALAGVRVMVSTGTPGVATTSAAAPMVTAMMVMVVMMLSRVAPVLTRISSVASCATLGPVAARLVVKLLMPRQAVDQTGSVGAPARRCRLLKAVNDISEIHGSVLLVVLAGPALDTLLVKVLLLERIQKRVYLLRDLVLLLSFGCSLLRGGCIGRDDGGRCRDDFDAVRQNFHSC